MDEDKVEEVTEGEIVEETSATQSDSDQATVLLSLENLIKNHIASIDKLKDEVKKQRQMLEDSFMNDAVYQEHLRLAKEAIKVKSATRLQITSQPQNIMLSNKIKSMTTELKDKQFALSDYLLEYQRLTGINEIEGEDGELREIVNTAKVVKRASKK
ncbi:MAG TPA: hypothetical protein VLB73_02665 [Patescibacteria group bacterium]|nr:hypothetical protein [Patescibacteria group bacterium]